MRKAAEIHAVPDILEIQRVRGHGCLQGFWGSEEAKKMGDDSGLI